MCDFSTEDTYLKQLSEQLSEILDKKRYAHTIGVAYTALSLAMAYGTDLYKAYLAGLLHDNAKCISAEKKRKLCKKHNLVLNEAEDKNPDLLHAKLGAIRAKEKFQVTDEEILGAIQYHTTGRPDMTELEKIIYIADYIEPNRKMLPGLSEIRTMAFQNLDKAMVLILQNTLAYLEKKGAAVDTLTQETYEYYMMRIANENR